MRRAKAKNPTRVFALVGLFAMAALGIFMYSVTNGQLRSQALREATGYAEVVESALRPLVPVDTYTLGTVQPEVAGALQERIGDFSDKFIRLRLWTADQELAFDSTGGKTGFVDAERFDSAALLGDASAEVITDVTGLDGADIGASSRTVVDVYVPIRYDGVLVGAAEISIDYTDTEQALTQATGVVGLTVGASMAGLFLLLVFTVYGQSRNLQERSLDNARLALLDPLTGLSNRRMLQERMARAIADPTVRDLGIGLILMDLDRFKEVNDSLGHSAGDDLLRQVADRLTTVFRDTDTIARLGGDEFAILLPSVRGAENAERLAHRVRQLFVPAFNLGELELHVECSIGLATLPEHAVDAEGLMQRADVAMYAAKDHRKGVQVYSSAADGSSPARLQLRTDLHRALAAGTEIVLHYQPKIDLLTGAVTGYEALARWQHPERGMIAPDVFVTLAEQSGLIDDLTRYVLDRAAEQAVAWRDAGHDRPIAVNLSAHNLTSLEMAEYIEELLARHNLHPEALEVEVTETAYVSDHSRILPALMRLRDAGVAVAVDDFGTGNTAIAQLPRSPAQVLKIDRMFISALEQSRRTEAAVAVVTAMVDLGHTFKMRVIAEGVEDHDTAACLAELDVDEAQGYLWSPAVPAAAVDELPEQFATYRTAALGAVSKHPSNRTTSLGALSAH